MSDISYDKIKHLVEVDDNILAAFTVLSGKEDYIDNLSILKIPISQKNLLIMFIYAYKIFLEI